MNKIIAQLLLMCVLFVFHSSCSDTVPAKDKTVTLQPFTGLHKDIITHVSNELIKIYPNVIVNDEIILPANAYYSARNRFRADSLLLFLKTINKNNQTVIGLTAKDISTTKPGYNDWGVMGLAYSPGNAGVVSTFRVSAQKVKEQFFKVVIHELGHTEGLPHCPIKTCYMRDAEGGNPTDQLTGFCSSCKPFLQDRGWKLL